MTVTPSATDGELSRFNPISELSQHPIPHDSEAVRELQDSDWAFPPIEQREPEYYSRDEIIDTHIQSIASHGPFEALTCSLAGYEQSVVIWDTDREFGIVFDNEEGDFFAVARAILNAALDGSLPVIETDADRDGFPLTAISSHPLLVPEEDIESFVANDVVLAEDFPDEVPHPDTLYLDYQTIRGEFGDWEFFTVETEQYSEMAFAWNSGLGEGFRIDLQGRDTRALLNVFTEVFDESQRTGDGSCPRCLGEMHDRSYPHGMAIKCSSCGFQQDF